VQLTEPGRFRRAAERIVAAGIENVERCQRLSLLDRLHQLVEVQRRVQHGPGARIYAGRVLEQEVFTESTCTPRPAK
jgi:hypothetical protein